MDKVVFANNTVYNSDSIVKEIIAIDYGKHHKDSEIKNNVFVQTSIKNGFQRPKEEEEQPLGVVFENNTKEIYPDFIRDAENHELLPDSSGDPATTCITHYYSSILERVPDFDGLVYWRQRVAENQALKSDVKPIFRDMANFFFNSEEYLGNGTSDEQFITDLYRTFFQREPEPAGKEYWLQQLKVGTKTRNEVMADFLYSPEFTSFMESLGF